MNIACGVITIKDKHLDHNKSAMMNMLQKSGEKDIEMIFFGEAVLHGFNGLSWDYMFDSQYLALSSNSEMINDIQSCCLQNYVGVGFGYFEKDDQKIYSSYLVIDKYGDIIANYRRCSPGWKPSDADQNHYSEGQDLATIHIGGKACLVSLCGDLWDDDYVYNVKQKHFDFIIWPVYIDYTEKHWQKSAKFEYCKQIQNIGVDTVLINAIDHAPHGANGGILDVNHYGEIVWEIPMNQEVFYEKIL